MLDRLEDRNRCSQVYDEKAAEAISQRIRLVYGEVLRSLPETLESELQGV